MDERVDAERLRLHVLIIRERSDIVATVNVRRPSPL